MREELTMLKVEDIIPHPKNPRKEIGDIEEIRKVLDGTHECYKKEETK